MPATTSTAMKPSISPSAIRSRPARRRPPGAWQWPCVVVVRARSRLCMMTTRGWVCSRPGHKTLHSRARVLMGLLFFPRGGSAHVARNLAATLPDAGWDATHPVRARSRCPGSPGDARASTAGLDVRPVDLTARARRARPAARRPAAPPLLRGPRGRAGPRVRLARRRRRRAPGRRLGAGAAAAGRARRRRPAPAPPDADQRGRARASRRTCRSSATCTAPSC